MATFAGLPDPTQVSSADAAARLAAAQAANLAWRTNTAPVLPRMGAPAPGSPGTEQDLTRIYVGGNADVQGTPMDLTRSQYIAQFGRTPEEAESAKHMEHFHPAEYFGTTMDAMQGMTLGQIASRYGSRAADYVQDYSREHPSARFQAITQAYEAQQQRSIDASGAYYQPTAAGSGKNPYPEDSAAGIAWEVAKTGGASDTRLNAIAAVEVTDIFGGDPGFITFATNQYIERPKFADEYLTTKEGGTIQNKAWEGVPIRQNITLAELNQLKTIPTGFELESGIHTAPGDWGGMYVPETSKSQETSDVPGRIRGDKTVAVLGDYIDVLGADALSTFVPYGRYSQEQLDNTKLGIARKTGELAIYQYNERFGTWDLIGGGGRNALQSGMFSVGKALTPYVATQGEIGTYERAPGKGKYRLGSEGSGGFVKEYGESGPRLLAPNEAISRYYGDGKYNLANLVDQVAAGKSEEPGADIPWAVLPTAPAIQYMDKSGMTGEKADVLEGVIYSVPMIGDLQKKANVGIGASDRLVGGGMVGGAGTIIDVQSDIPETTTIIEKPTGKIFGADIPFISPLVAFFQPGSETTTEKTTKQIPESTAFERREYSETPYGYMYTDYYKTSGGQEITEIATTKQTPSGFDTMFEGSNVAIRGALGFDKIPTPTTEQVKETAPFLTTLVGVAPVGIALKTPVLGDYVAEYLRGEIKGIQEKPAQAGLMFGAGAVMGGAFKAGETIYGIGRSGIAPKVISEGGIWRGVEQGGEAIMKYGPKILGGLYAADVGIRATAKGTDFSPASAGRLGTIVATEARPMTAGAILGYTGPGKVYEIAKTSDINYKAAVQEGATSGRFDYYVKKPAMKPYEFVKQDYMAYAQERPDLPEMTRLYRGETGRRVHQLTEGTGRWFTEDPAYARSYGENLYYVDVQTKSLPIHAKASTLVNVSGEPDANALSKLSSRVANFGTGERVEYFVTPEVAARKQMVVGDTNYGGYDILNDVIKKPTVVDYLRYKSGIDTTPAPEPTTLKPRQSFVIEDNIIKPVTTEPPADIATLAYRGKVGTGRYVQVPKEPMTLGRIMEAEATAPDVVAKAYGKEPGILDFSRYGKQAEPSTLGNYALDEFAVDTRKVYPRDYSIGQKIDIWQQEHPTFFRDVKSQLVRPSQEISDINRMFQISKDYAAAQKVQAAAKPSKPFRRTPFGVTFGKGKAKPAEPAKGVEVRGKSGAVSIARVEEVSKPVELIQRGYAGTVPSLAPIASLSEIRYPSGPSPVQRRVAEVEEEPEYVRKGTEVIVQQKTGLQQVPAAMISTLPAMAEVVARKQIPDFMQVSEQRASPMSVFAEIQRQRFGTEPAQTTRTGKELAFGITPRFTSDVTQRTGIAQETRRDVTRLPIQEIVPLQKQTVIQRPWSELTRLPPPEVPAKVPFGLPAFGGGGGGGGYRKGSRAYVETLGLVGKQFDPFSKSKAKPRKKSKWSF